MFSQHEEGHITDTRSDLHRGEARAGNPVKGLLLVVGLAAIWYTGGGRIGAPTLAACLLYAMVSLGFVIIFRQKMLPQDVVPGLVIVSYVTDLLFVSFLVAATGGLSSDLYILYGPLALKAAVYYPPLPVLLLVSYLIAPLYALALRQTAGGWWFLTDPAFLPRYVLLGGLIFTAMYMAWLFERRQVHIRQLTESLNAKALVLEQTATGLADRLIELRTLQEGIKAINSSLALEEMLRLIVVNASQVLGVAQCIVSLLDEETANVLPRAVSGMPIESLRGSQLKLATSVASLVIQTGKAALIGDARTDPRLVPSDDCPVASVMCVPLLADNKPVGALTAMSRKRNAFQEDDLNLLAAFADQAAMGVKNAGLYYRLAEEKKRTEAIIQGLGDGVIVTDSRMNLVLLNPAAAQIFGLHESPPAGTPIARLIADESTIDLLARTLDGDTVPVMGEVALPGARSDRKRVYHVLATAVRDEKNTVHNIVAVLRDITSRKEVEEMKSNFLSVVSHELKTPLHSIKGFVDIILMGKTGHINDTQREFLTIVKTQTTQLQNQINDLLEFSRLESGQVRLRIEEVSLAEVAQAVIEKLAPQAEEAQITLTSTLPPDFPVIRGDRARLEQVLTNLVDNGIKFTPAGGTVTIDGQDQADAVRLSVTDTGIGIPQEAQKYVFDRFYQVDGSPTRSYRGTGLGLTICRHIVEQHQGRIWVESGEGKGSTFFVLLPKNPAVSAQDAALDFAAFPTSLDQPA